MWALFTLNTARKNSRQLVDTPVHLIVVFNGCLESASESGGRGLNISQKTCLYDWETILWIVLFCIISPVNHSEGGVACIPVTHRKGGLIHIRNFIPCVRFTRNFHVHSCPPHCLPAVWAITAYPSYKRAVHCSFFFICRRLLRSECTWADVGSPVGLKELWWWYKHGGLQ